MISDLENSLTVNIFMDVEAQRGVIIRYHVLYGREYQSGLAINAKSWIVIIFFRTSKGPKPVKQTNTFSPLILLNHKGSDSCSQT